MTPRLKAGLLGLLTHRDPAIAASARRDLAKSDDPAKRALLDTSRARSEGVSDGPRRADRVAKSVSRLGSNSTRPGAGTSKTDRPGNAYSFSHLAHVARKPTGVAPAVPPPSTDALARRMLAAAGIATAPTASAIAAWQPAAPKTFPSADAAARAALTAAGVSIPKAGAPKQ